MRNNLCFLLLLLVTNFSSIGFSQRKDSIYYYDYDFKGEKVWTYIQADVYMFRFVDGMIFQTGQTDFSIVDTIVNPTKLNRNMHIMTFLSSATEMEREAERNKVRTAEFFHCDYTAYSNDSKKSQDSCFWGESHDLILILFKDSLISDSVVAQFAADRNLKLTNMEYMELKDKQKRALLFKMDASICIGKSNYDLSREIQELDTALVLFASPSLGFFIPDGGGANPPFIEEPLDTTVVSIKFYPNPIEGISKLVFPNMEEQTHYLTIYNSLGEGVMLLQSNDYYFELHKEDFANGIYHYLLEDSEHKIISRDKFLSF